MGRFSLTQLQLCGTCCNSVIRFVQPVCHHGLTEPRLPGYRYVGFLSWFQAFPMFRKYLLNVHETAVTLQPHRPTRAAGRDDVTLLQIIEIKDDYADCGAPKTSNRSNWSSDQLGLSQPLKVSAELNIGVRCRQQRLWSYAGNVMVLGGWGGGHAESTGKSSLWVAGGVRFRTATETGRFLSRRVECSLRQTWAGRRERSVWPFFTMC